VADRDWTKIGGVAGVLGVVVAIVAIFVSVMTSAESKSAPTPPAADAATATPVPPVVAVPVPLSTSIPATAPDSGAISRESSEAVDGRSLATSSIALNLDNSVDSDDCHQPHYRGAPWREGPQTIGGTTFRTGFQCSIGAKAVTGYRDYGVPPGYGRLTAHCGVDDSSPNTTTVVEFTIRSVADDRVLYTNRLRFGEIGDIDVPLTGVQRVRLEINQISAEISPYDKIAFASWAEATLHST
jgi:hypothetical protein